PRRPCNGYNLPLPGARASRIPARAPVRGRDRRLGGSRLPHRAGTARPAGRSITVGAGRTRNLETRGDNPSPLVETMLALLVTAYGVGGASAGLLQARR